jgi:MYXO-CTERM domain-containing protein
MKGPALAFAIAPLLSVLGGESLAMADTWTGTWAASPESSSTSFAQQTLRQIVHTSISGAAARIQLSNAFGTQAVTIGDVHIAQRDSGSSVVASSDCQVTFGGQSSVTLAAGAVAVSDSIPFPVTALADVAISFYLPDATGSATSHSLGEQTNYVVSGDVSGSPTLTNPQTNGSYFFLANLDVQSSTATGAVVTLGASITDGFASTSDENLRWPNDLAGRIVDAGLAVGVLNQGISGNQLLVDGSGQSALHRFSRDVISQPGVKWVIFSDDPINDLGDNNPPPTSAQLIAGATQLISQAHASGLLFLCSTLTPYQGAGYWTSQGETEREAYNAFVRGPGSGCDAIVDQDTATHDPSNPTQFLPAYDSGDHLHPNDQGYQAIADAVDLALFSVPSDDAGAPSDAATPEDAGALPDAATPEDAGGSDSDGGGPVSDASGASEDGADGSTSTDGSTEDAGGGGGGCGCRTAPGAPTGPGLIAAAVGLSLALSIAGRRRRARAAG